MKIKSLFRPAAYRRKVLQTVAKGNKSWHGVLFNAPGHFYSPLIDIESLESLNCVPADDKSLWECANLSQDLLRSMYAELLQSHPTPNYLDGPVTGSRYYAKNGYFAWGDAFILSAMMRKFQPKRIVEVGSGFSSAVMLDTADEIHLNCKLTFIEPYPDRLQSVLTDEDAHRTHIEMTGVQNVNPALFENLEANDICFIDSSHVAKVGSDVTWLFLHILPRLKPGVLIHVHDIFYPESYPMNWIREGRAWNESILLRAYLAGNRGIETIAFNAWAQKECPELFAAKEHVAFIENCGASFWMRVV